jgi:hypothetical protein
MWWDVTGLGMNADELKRNTALTEWTVRDLNAGVLHSQVAGRLQGLPDFSRAFDGFLSAWTSCHLSASGARLSYFW